MTISRDTISFKNALAKVSQSIAGLRCNTEHPTTGRRPKIMFSKLHGPTFRANRNSVGLRRQSLRNGRFLTDKKINMKSIGTNNPSLSCFKHAILAWLPDGQLGYLAPHHYIDPYDGVWPEGTSDIEAVMVPDNMINSLLKSLDEISFLELEEWRKLRNARDQLVELKYKILAALDVKLAVEATRPTFLEGPEGKKTAVFNGDQVEQREKFIQRKQLLEKELKSTENKLIEVEDKIKNCVDTAQGKREYVKSKVLGDSVSGGDTYCVKWDGLMKAHDEVAQDKIAEWVQYKKDRDNLVEQMYKIRAELEIRLVLKGKPEMSKSHKPVYSEAEVVLREQSLEEMNALERNVESLMAQVKRIDSNMENCIQEIRRIRQHFRSTVVGKPIAASNVNQDSKFKVYKSPYC